MTATTSTILTVDDEVTGNLYITNPRVLIRPGSPRQYPYSVKHDSVFANGILAMGNDMGAYTWHIISPLGPALTHQVLDDVFYAYVDMECFGLWCDARVDYIVDHACVFTRDYGFSDGSYTMKFKVHCNVPETETEAYLASLVAFEAMPELCKVVRPDSSELGYAISVAAVPPSPETLAMRRKAAALAQYICSISARAVGVEIFGSIGRGQGTLESDFDMIVVVDGFTSARWFYEVRDVVKDDLYDESVAGVRQRLALEMLGIDPAAFLNGDGILPWKLDFFLFPSDWRDRLDELQALGLHTDPNFMRNIAHDARTFVPGQGFPFPV